MKSPVNSSHEHLRRRAAKLIYQIMGLCSDATEAEIATIQVRLIQLNRIIEEAHAINALVRMLRIPEGGARGILGLADRMRQAKARENPGILRREICDLLRRANINVGP